MSKGSKSPNQTYSDVTQVTSNLPEYAEPFYKDLLARTGYETATDYVPYTGQRMAYFSPMEQEAMARMGELGVSGQDPYLQQATQYAAASGQGFAPNIDTNFASTYNPGTFGGSYGEQSRDSGYQAGQYSSGYRANQMRDPTGGYEAGSREVGFEPGQLNDPEMIDSYMSPYMQQVVEIQKREAMRDADKRHRDLKLGAGQAGQLGGYGQGILQAETERDLGQRLDDLQAEGSQAAFLNAQQAYEADRGARAQLEAFQQSQFGQNEQAKQFMANAMQQGFSLNEAARQAQEQFGQSAFGMNEAARQAQEQMAQSQFGLNMQDRQFGSQFGLQAFQAQEAANAQAAAMRLQADQLRQSGQIAEANALMQQQQNMLNAANSLAGMSAQNQAMEMERLNAMMGVGGMERALIQQGLDTGYQDFLRQQAWPREQLAFYSAMLQGTPVQPGTTTATYGPQPSTGQQMLGMGLGGLSMWNAMGGGNG